MSVGCIYIKGFTIDLLNTFRPYICSLSLACRHGTGKSKNNITPFWILANKVYSTNNFWLFTKWPVFSRPRWSFAICLGFTIKQRFISKSDKSKVFAPIQSKMSQIGYRDYSESNYSTCKWCRLNTLAEISWINSHFWAVSWIPACDCNPNR